MIVGWEVAYESCSHVISIYLPELSFEYLKCSISHAKHPGSIPNFLSMTCCDLISSSFPLELIFPCLTPKAGGLQNDQNNHCDAENSSGVF